MWGINALGAQLCSYIFILCNTHLNLALLLHKTVLKMFLLASTVMGGGKDITFFSCWMKSVVALGTAFGHLNHHLHHYFHLGDI